jgi:ribosome assembly protein YihI (activator of Der GTPase)
MAKTTKPMVRIHNTETDEVIDREMTDAEFAEYEANQVAKATAQAEVDAKAEARQAILDRLGITADEAAILLG